jgi:hypothetical protein
MDVYGSSRDILQSERVKGSQLVKYLYWFISCFMAFGSFWEVYIYWSELIILVECVQNVSALYSYIPTHAVQCIK